MQTTLKVDRHRYLCQAVSHELTEERRGKRCSDLLASRTTTECLGAVLRKVAGSIEGDQRLQDLVQVNGRTPFRYLRTQVSLRCDRHTIGS